MTMQDAYALARKDIELLEEAQEQWKGEAKRWKEAEEKAKRRGEAEEIIFVMRSEGGLFAVFNEPLRKSVESLLAIDNPVAHVAKERDLDADTLLADMAGEFGWDGKRPKKGRSKPSARK
jgi:hypothetical protein